MGIFKRLKSVLNGFFESFTTKAEDRNPEYLIADTESRIKKCKKEAQKQLVEVQTWAETVKIDMREAEKKLADTRRKIQIAVKENNKELLVELLMREEEFENLYDERKQLYDAAVNEAIRIRDDFKQFENEMNMKLYELQTMRSQTKLVVLREQIQKIGNSYETASGGAIKERIDKLKSSLNTRCARIIATEQLNSENSGLRYNRLDYAAKKDRAALRAADILRLEQAAGYDKQTLDAAQ
ncbi:MAG: hypothetical protein IJZ94_05400 [Clostridia bacterium]|nr:hypothetical protein [Clostridia bacterium]